RTHLLNRLLAWNNRTIPTGLREAVYHDGFSDRRSKPTQLFCFLVGAIVNFFPVKEIRVSKPAKRAVDCAAVIVVLAADQGAVIQVPQHGKLVGKKIRIYPAMPLCTHFHCFPVVDVSTREVPVYESFGHVGADQVTPAEFWRSPHANEAVGVGLEAGVKWIVGCVLEVAPKWRLAYLQQHLLQHL